MMTATITLPQMTSYKCRSALAGLNDLIKVAYWLHKPEKNTYVTDMTAAESNMGESTMEFCSTMSLAEVRLHVKKIVDKHYDDAHRVWATINFAEAYDGECDYHEEEQDYPVEA
jgi:hypothetical protein